MGALHAGHISLVKLAKKKADKAVVSIFVNPTQFAPHEDLARYPRDEAGDLTKLGEADADLVWSPSVEEMYPAGFSTTREGRKRRGRSGRRFPPASSSMALRPYAASCSIRSRPTSRCSAKRIISSSPCSGNWSSDLNMPLKLVAAPTMRETDGLALSSRNAYLSRSRARDCAGALRGNIRGRGEGCSRSAGCRLRPSPSDAKPRSRRLYEDRLRRDSRRRNAGRRCVARQTSARSCRRLARQDAIDR